MTKLFILLALAVSGAVGDDLQAQDFLGQIWAAQDETHHSFLRQIENPHDATYHSDRFLLCSQMPAVRTLEVNFFSVNNVAEFLNGAKPTLQEMNTVVLNESRPRVNCTATIEDWTINFGQTRVFSSRSGDLNQRVNTANIPFQRIGHAICNDDVSGDCMPTLVQQGEGYLIEGATINDLLINGVDLTHYRNEITANPRIKGDLPELENDRFDILSQLHYPRKLSLSSDEDTYAKIKLINEQNEMLWWKTESSNSICTQFAGNNGEYFNDVTEHSVLHYYSEDLCATAILIYDSVDNSHGFPALKFVFYPDSFSSGGCYSTSANLASGAFDVNGCQNGLPFVISYPHFLEADSSYHDKLEGMRPAAANHQSYFIIEPVTGMLVEYSQKFQLNVNLQKFRQDGNINGNGTMPDTILPLYWFDKKYQLDDTHLNAIKSVLQNPSNPTTSVPTTTARPVSGGDDSTIQHKLDNISYRLTVVSVVVFTFVVVAVIILAAFTFLQIRHNRKLLLNRSNGLPSYDAPYEAKP